MRPLRKLSLTLFPSKSTLSGKAESFDSNPETLTFQLAPEAATPYQSSGFRVERFRVFGFRVKVSEDVGFGNPGLRS